MGRIVSVVSGKGGVGKTTVVVNVGAALAHYFKKKVVVVDCNITTSHLALALGMHHVPANLNQVLRGEIALEEALYKHNSGMLVLPASLKLQDLQGVDLMKLKPLLKKLSEGNDFVLLDAGPGLGREALSAVHSSQEIIFVAIPTLPSIMDVLRYLEFLQDYDKRHLGLILNMVQKDEGQLNSKDVERMTPLAIISQVPRDKHVPQSLSAQVPVVLAFPAAKASKELLNIARHLAGLPVEREVKVGILDSIADSARGMLERLSRFPSLE